jgi:hypothetical protein
MVAHGQIAQNLKINKLPMNAYNLFLPYPNIFFSLGLWGWSYNLIMNFQSSKA